MARAYMVNLFGCTTSSGGSPSTSMLYCRPITAYISGTVKDTENNPLTREIRLYRYEDYMFDSSVARSPYAITTSNASTGAFSFTVRESSKREWVVTCIGVNGENIITFHHIRVDD